MADEKRLARLRGALIQYNQGQVMSVVPLMLKEYTKRWHPYVEQRDEFYRLFQRMENSNANYPFGYMTNYYFRNFERPITPFYDGQYSFDEQNYRLLTEQEMMDLERKFRVDEITAEVQKSTQEIRDYGNEVVAKNAPIRHLKGMGEFYTELVAIRDDPWYYSEDIVSQLQPKGEYRCPEGHAALGLKMPFHRELYIKLHPAYATFDILEAKLKRLKTVLDSISSDLAFSELREGTTEELAIDQVKLPRNTAELANFLFDKMQFHPKIVNASRALFEHEHYAQAIFEAFKAVENFVQDKSGLTLYGTNLMERVFNEENPIIKVPEAGHYYKEVQKGFKHLFIGASQGIRNPKAHKEIIQKDPYITLQYLGFFSFLLKRIDYWETGIS